MFAKRQNRLLKNRRIVGVFPKSQDFTGLLKEFVRSRMDLDRLAEVEPGGSRNRPRIGRREFVRVGVLSHVVSFLRGQQYSVTYLPGDLTHRMT